MENENLIGRWVKALEDYPQGANISKNTFVQIDAISYNGKSMDFKNGYCGTIDYTNSWQIMPEGWKPGDSEEINSNILLKAGDYVVLLSSCTGKNDWSHSMPENYVYILSKDFSKQQFYVNKDINGSKNNGWSSSTLIAPYNKMAIRPATEEEIQAYNKNSGPINVTEIAKNVTYKEGDVVVCIINENLDSTSGSGWQKDLCFKVADIHTYGDNRDVIWKVEGQNGVYQDHLRLATSEEIFSYNKIGKSFYISDIPKQEEYNEPPTPKTTEQIFLEEAKRRYPIGGTYEIDQVSAYGVGNKYTISPLYDKDYRYSNNDSENVAVCDKGVYSGKKQKWAEIISPKSEDEQLIEEAYRRYPVGSFFKSINNSCLGNIREVQPFDKNPIKFIILLQEGRKTVYATRGMKNKDINNQYVCSNPYVWHEDKGWAEIIENPNKALSSLPSEKEVLQKFPPGTKFKDLVHFKEVEVMDDELNYYDKDQNIYIRVKQPNVLGNRTCCIYKKGKWAEIINNFKKYPFIEKECLPRLNWHKLNLQDWLRETRSLNLSEEELAKHIWENTTYVGVWDDLKGIGKFEKAEILWNEWHELVFNHKPLEERIKQIKKTITIEHQNPIIIKTINKKRKLISI